MGTVGPPVGTTAQYWQLDGTGHRSGWFFNRGSPTKCICPRRWRVLDHRDITTCPGGCSQTSALHKFSRTVKSMAWCKTVISPLLKHWRYCSLALSHRNDEAVEGIRLDRRNIPKNAMVNIQRYIRPYGPEHYIDVIMTMMASQITGLMVVYSTVYSDADQRKHQNSASLAFVWGIHRDRWISHTKGELRGKCFHLMTSSLASQTWNNWVNISSVMAWRIGNDRSRVN